MNSIQRLFAVVCVMNFTHSFSQEKNPLLISFKNITPISVFVDLFFADATRDTQIIGSGKKFVIPNFSSKQIKKVIIRSQEKDQNGNLYEQAEIRIGLSKQDVEYGIGLQTIPSKTVPATKDTEEFIMPETQKLTCNILIL